MNKKVAIILLNWNGAAVTIDCLQSLRKINYPSYRIFLVDNGSADGSVKQIKEKVKNPDIEYIQLAFNYGFTGGNNVGIVIASQQYKPDYFLLLNNDTVVDPDFLNYLVTGSLTDKDIGITVPKIFFYDSPDKLYYAGGYINSLSGMGEHYHWCKKETVKDNISRTVEFANGCAMLISADTIQKAGVLDDRFFANIEDVEYSYRIRKKGFTIKYEPAAVLWHKEGYSSKENKGQWFRIYLSTRNLLLFYYKRKHWYSGFIFYPYFLLRWVGYMSCKMLLKKDYKSVRALFSGVRDGWSGRLHYVKRPDEIIYIKD